VNVGGVRVLRRRRPPSASVRLLARASPMPCPFVPGSAGAGERRVNSWAGRGGDAWTFIGDVDGERLAGVPDGHGDRARAVQSGIVQQHAEHLAQCGGSTRARSPARWWR